jgi:hypothetical protein
MSARINPDGGCAPQQLRHLAAQSSSATLSAIVVVMVRRRPRVVTALTTCEPSDADRVVSRWARIAELTAKQGEHGRGDGILLGSELEF